MDIENKLYTLAKDLIEQRHPKGWGGAAAIRLQDGTFLTSLAPEVLNDSISLWDMPRTLNLLGARGSSGHYQS